MSTPLAPPPLQVPPDFSTDKIKAAFFGGLLNTIYQMWTSLYGIRTTSKVKTTDNTITGLIRVAVPTDKTVMIEARVVARRTGGVSGTVGDSAFFTLTGAYKNVGGLLTGIGTPDLVAGKDNAAWTVAFSFSSEFAIVTVLGAAGNDVTWEGTISSFIVGA